MLLVHHLHEISPPDPLNAQCKNETIFEMSHVPFDWKSVGIHLLGTEFFRKIDQELLGALNEQEKKISILHMWLEKAQAKATYRVLVELLESMRNTAAANAVRKWATLHSADGGKSSITLCGAYNGTIFFLSIFLSIAFNCVAHD